MIAALAALFIEVSPLIERYRNECAPSSRTIVTLESNNGATSLRIALTYDGEVIGSAATHTDMCSAALLLADLVKDRHNRCRIRSVSAAEERTADADFEAVVKSSDASDGEPE